MTLRHELQQAELANLQDCTIVDQHKLQMNYEFIIEQILITITEEIESQSDLGNFGALQFQDETEFTQLTLTDHFQTATFIRETYLTGHVSLSQCLDGHLNPYSENSYEIMKRNINQEFQDYQDNLDTNDKLTHEEELEFISESEHHHFNDLTLTAKFINPDQLRITFKQNYSYYNDILPQEQTLTLSVKVLDLFDKGLTTETYPSLIKTYIEQILALDFKKD